MARSGNPASDDPGNRPTGEAERIRHADRQRLQDAPGDSILDTEGEPAETYAEQEGSYSRDAGSIPDRNGKAG